MGATKKKKAMKMDKVIKYLIFGLLVLLILFGSALMINAYFKRMGAEGPFSKGEEKVITDSVLKDMVEVEELSSLKFRYNGIANYKDKVGINYKSTVTAKIDMNKIEIHVDHENKVVYISLPKQRITAKIDDKLDFIPDNTSMDIKYAYATCKKDAEKEAKKSKGLLQLADQSLKNNVEALILPLIDDYQIEWKTADK